jgi:hypothetical protein
MNDEQLGRAVRAAFDRYELDVPATEMMTQRASERRRWTLVALPAVAAALALAIVVQSFVRPESAFASWTPVPGNPDPALAAAAEKDCRYAGASNPALDLPLVGQDQRGRAALALFSDGTDYALCLGQNGAPGADGSVSGGLGVVYGKLPPLVGPLTVATAGSGGIEGQTVTNLAGQVAAVVARVEIVRDDGTVVSATISRGYFLAWWPGSAATRELRAYDAGGSLLVTMPNPVGG